MPEVTQEQSQPPLPTEEATKPEVEALPADGESIIFAEEGNTKGWLKFDPDGAVELPLR